MNTFLFKKIGYSICLLFILTTLPQTKLIAQCQPSSIDPVSIGSVSSTQETCPQNGSITISGITGGGNQYVYEIVNGPIIRGIQSQNIFSALSAGTYTIRVTGCNGKFRDIQATVPRGYQKFGNASYPILSISANFIAQSTSFKCGITNNGKAIIRVSDKFDLGTLADSVFRKRPYRYQVSTNPDSYTGFDGIPYHFFPYRSDNSDAEAHYQVFFDTLTNLNANTTYYIRITDECGVYETKTLYAVNTPTVIN